MASKVSSLKTVMLVVSALLGLSAFQVSAAGSGLPPDFNKFTCSEGPVRNYLNKTYLQADLEGKVREDLKTASKAGSVKMSQDMSITIDVHNSLVVDTKKVGEKYQITGLKCINDPVEIAE